MLVNNLSRRSPIKRQSGFTLIELIIVIVLLGVLSVTAAPKFIDLTSDAHISVSKATAAAFKSAVKLVNSVYRIRQTTPIQVVGGTVNIDTTTGYPTGSGSGAQFCVNLWNDLLANAEPVTGQTNPSATLTEGWNSFGNSSACSYGKKFEDKTFGSGDLPHFVYYIQDVSSFNFNGQIYGGKAGEVQLFNM
ncbi:type II secretion system protein [Paraglaciecola aestuariivivens]